MKKILLLIFVLLLFITGCINEKEATFNNKTYEEVYNKTLQFVIYNNWQVIYENKEAGSIQAILKTHQLYGSAYTQGPVMLIAPSQDVKDTIMFVIIPRENNVIVKIKANVEAFLAWDPEITFKEYEDFVNLGKTK